MENIETPTKNEPVSGPYTHPTLLDPNKKDFLKILEEREKGGLTVLDIGCGEEPRLSWELGSNDTWVGCDPAIKLSEDGRVSIHIQSGSVDKESKLIVFTESAEDIPSFKPDYISIIAPNPKDIVDGRIFNEGLEKFLTNKKEQKIIIALDDRTFESAGYREEAIETIEKWMGDNNFKSLGEGEDDYEDLKIDDRFHPNSADLGELGTLYMLFSN